MGSCQPPDSDSQLKGTRLSHVTKYREIDRIHRENRSAVAQQGEKRDREEECSM